MSKAFSFSRKGPDHLAEALAEALSSGNWLEFKSLFSLLYTSLRARNAAGGGEDMLRLRTYDKLQGFVRNGLVEKRGKEYRAVTPALSTFMEHVRAERCRTLLHTISAKPSVVPKPD